MVKDLATLEKKHAKVLTSYKQLLADSETAKRDLEKARVQSQKMLALSAKILSRTKERESQLQAREQAISKARKQIVFYTTRINKWNQSRNLKSIDIQL